jgi:lipopolysaccharide export system permease protein
MANNVKNNLSEKSKANNSKYLARSKIGNSGIIWYKSQGYFSSFAAYDRKNQELKDFSIYYLSDKGLIESIFKAKSAKYDSENLWQLTGLEILQNLSDDKFPQKRKEKSLLISLDEKPSDFIQFESDISTLNIFKLYSFITRLKKTGINFTDYEIMFLEKLSNSLICIIFALFPLAGIFSPNRRNSSFGKSIVLTLSFTIAFWGIYSASISLGTSGRVPPLVATMAIPFLFSLFIGNTYFKNKKL